VAITKPKLLLFGARGSIGQNIKSFFCGKGWNVISVGRGPGGEPDSGTPGPWIALDPDDEHADYSLLDPHAPYDAVCWAQGANCSDSIYSVDGQAHLDLYRANCLFILLTLKALLTGNRLTSPARLCVISSIWQDVARQQKLSYTVTKAALQGLVLSASIDLGEAGHLINAVLPGALDTPMTRANLNPQQLDRLQSGTLFGRLATIEDVSALVWFLCSPENKSITGQFINVDLGFSRAHIV